MFKINNISIKIINLYIDPLKKIYSNKYTKLKPIKQKKISNVIKQFRYLNLLPFSTVPISFYKNTKKVKTNYKKKNLFK